MLNIVSSKARGEGSMSAKNGSIKLVAGNANPALAQEIANWLHLPLTKAIVRRFADMEIFVEIQENVRGSDVFIIQSTSYPANDHLMELLIITDALRRASARRITAVIPYFGYARQDRKVGSRSPISAKLVANIITRAGVDRVMTLDLHAGQIQGFFDIPFDHLYAMPVLIDELRLLGLGGEQIVGRNIEEALNLPGVQVERHHAIGAGAGDQVGDQLGRDRGARSHFAILPRVAEIRDHRRNAPRRCPA